jgi:peptidoglycan/LPS O-acetylase OafA/YrhL
MDKQKHIKSLTSLRGIAAVTIVVLHFSYYTLPQIGKILSTYSHFFHNGYLWVDFFFILSGFIMTHVYGKYFESGVSFAKYRSYLLSRIARIYPLHIFILLLMIGGEIAKIYWLNIPAFVDKFNLTALATNIFLLQAFDLNCPPLFWCDTYWNEPAWSISVEFIIYGLFPFLLFYLSKIKQRLNFIIYIIALILILLLIKFTRGNLDAIIGIPAIFRCGLECLLGMITYRIYDLGNYRKYVNLNLLAIISTIWIVGIMHTWIDRARSFHDWAILPAFSGLILAVATQSDGLYMRILNSRLMVYLGTISYSIYMVHWSIGELIKTIWLDRFHVPFGSNFQDGEAAISLGIFMSIVLLFSSLTYKFVEVPIRDRLKPKAFGRIST